MLTMPTLDLHQNVDSHGRGDTQRRASGIVQVVTFTGAVVSNTWRAMTGKEVFVPDEVYNSRMSICRACPQFDAKMERCRMCGCGAKRKLKLANQHCPLNEPKWGTWTATT